MRPEITKVAEEKSKKIKVVVITDLEVFLADSLEHFDFFVNVVDQVEESEQLGHHDGDHVGTNVSVEPDQLHLVDRQNSCKSETMFTTSYPVIEVK